MTLIQQLAVQAGFYRDGTESLHIASNFGDCDEELHKFAVELAAYTIYNQWADQRGFVPWVIGGNSLRQDEARKQARALLGEPGPGKGA